MCIRDSLQVGEDGLRLGDGPQGHRFFYAALPHDPQSLGDAGGVVGLQVAREQVRPRLGKGFEDVYKSQT